MCLYYVYVCMGSVCEGVESVWKMCRKGVVSVWDSVVSVWKVCGKVWKVCGMCGDGAWTVLGLVWKGGG